MATWRVCPWWIGSLLASPLRRLVQDPDAVLAGHVQPGMTVLEPGPGMGFFTLELARRVGPAGRVIAADIQPRMIAGLLRRARKAGLAERIDARVVSPAAMALDDIEGRVDFVLAFAVAHEMAAPAGFFAAAARALKPGATLLLAEPQGHVGTLTFAAEIAEAERAGLEVAAHPQLRRARAALLRKPQAAPR